MAKNEGKVVKDPFGKIFGKLGITGIASSILTLVIGIIMILYRDVIELEQIILLIGLYFVIVGIINLIGYVSTVIARNKASKIYIETETIKGLKE